MGFRYSIRTQFNFNVQDRKLSCILSNISERRINITGFVQLKKANRCNLVKLVVGTADAESANDLRLVRKVLRLFVIKFEEKQVIQIRNITPGVPGVFNSTFGALWCKVRVKAFYPGEKSRLFLQVSDVKRAIRILSKRNAQQCL